eukprot:9000605-Karenia_brevis.AAC.1
MSTTLASWFNTWSATHQRLDELPTSVDLRKLEDDFQNTIANVVQRLKGDCNVTFNGEIEVVEIPGRSSGEPPSEIIRSTSW